MRFIESDFDVASSGCSGIFSELDCGAARRPWRWQALGVEVANSEARSTTGAHGQTGREDSPGRKAPTNFGTLALHAAQTLSDDDQNFSYQANFEQSRKVKTTSTFTSTKTAYRQIRFLDWQDGRRNFEQFPIAS